MCQPTNFILMVIPNHHTDYILYGKYTLAQGNVSMADSRFAPSQWETALLCNDISHWLGANLESALWHLFISTTTDRHFAWLMEDSNPCWNDKEPIARSSLTGGFTAPGREGCYKNGNSHGLQVTASKPTISMRGGKSATRWFLCHDSVMIWKRIPHYSFWEGYLPLNFHHKGTIMRCCFLYR